MLRPRQSGPQQAERHDDARAAHRFRAAGADRHALVGCDADGLRRDELRLALSDRAAHEHAPDRDRCVECDDANGPLGDR